MLALGAQLGLLIGVACRFVLPDLDTLPVAFAVVGVAAFFAGVVTAPVAGIALGICLARPAQADPCSALADKLIWVGLLLMDSGISP
jgi:hypothetical protein